LEADKIVILPSYNEISSLIKICKEFKKKKVHFVVLDDNSNDGTYGWLKKNKINFIRNKENLGYEKNIKKGFKYALKKKKLKYVITFDADGQHKISDLLNIYKILDKNNIDLLICNRKIMNRFSEYLLSFLYNFFYKIKDPLSGLKAYKVNIIKNFKNNIKDNYFLIDIVSSSLKNDFKVKNYPITTNTSRHSRIGNNIGINLKILKCLRYL
tara:strand:+ start:9417 stop:10052 length:636 start_codon:yes stop_codon:yes gene_type:complete